MMDLWLNKIENLHQKIASIRSNNLLTSQPLDAKHKVYKRIDVIEKQLRELERLTMLIIMSNNKSSIHVDDLCSKIDTQLDKIFNSI